MRAPSEMDEGGALSLKTQFVHFMKNGKHGRQIEDYKEVGERFLQWAKTRTEPIDALQSYMGTEWNLAQEIERIEKRRDPSPYRAPAKQTREESPKERNIKRRHSSGERDRSRERGARDESRERGVREKSRDRSRERGTKDRSRERSRERGARNKSCERSRDCGARKRSRDRGARYRSHSGEVTRTHHSASTKVTSTRQKLHAWST